MDLMNVSAFCVSTRIFWKQKKKKRKEEKQIKKREEKKKYRFMEKEWSRFGTIRGTIEKFDADFETVPAAGNVYRCMQIEASARDCFMPRGRGRRNDEIAGWTSSRRGKLPPVFSTFSTMLVTGVTGHFAANWVEFQLRRACNSSNS